MQGSVAAVCCFQVALSEHLKTLEVYHISTIPKCRLPLLQLYAAAADTDAAEILFQELRRTLGTLLTSYTLSTCISAHVSSSQLISP